MQITGREERGSPGKWTLPCREFGRRFPFISSGMVSTGNVFVGSCFVYLFLSLGHYLGRGHKAFRMSLALVLVLVTVSPM